MKKSLLSPRNQIIFSMLVFGTVGLFVRWIPLPSTLIACARGVIGAAFLFAIMKLRGGKIHAASIRKNALMLILSGAALGFNWVLLFEAYRYTTVATATLCYYLAPMIITLLSPVFLKEKLTARKIACCFVALVGMAFVSGVLSGNMPTGAELKGILLGLGSAALYATVVLLNKKIRDVDARDRTVVQLGLSAVLMFVYAVFTGESLLVSLSSLQGALLLTVGILHTGVAYLSYFSALRDIKAQSAAILSYIDPVAAILLSALLLGETLSLHGVMGAVLILGSALVSETGGKER